MKKLFFTITYLIVSFITGTMAFAARVYMEAPSMTGVAREPIAVIVYLDPERDTISGVGGELTVDSTKFDVASIIAGNSSIPLWVTTPNISAEHYLDNRTHIVFDGIIPGGFKGVMTSSVKGTYPGVLFIVNLIPKRSGVTQIDLDSVEIRAFDEKATLLSSQGQTKHVFIPILVGKVKQSTPTYTQVPNTSLTYSLGKSEYVSNGETYLYIQETNPTRLIEHIEYSEAYEYDPSYINTMYWHKSTNPYILIDQTRSRYIHAKVFFSDNTYTYLTIPPVENSQSISKTSHILIFIGIVIVLGLLYDYGKHYFEALRTTWKKRS
jgi:hypothetical protein